MPPPAARQFSGIFVSYRRDDSSGHAGRLFDRLVDHFDRDRIFMDIDTIEPGEDFVTVIENAVGSCEILIAMIGRHWLSSTGESPGWLDNPNDFVRLEIAAALSRDIRVIPVLVQRATMPKPQDLPDDLKKLCRRNAIELSDLRWQNDVERLISVMDRILEKREEAIRLAEAARQADEERRRQEEEQRRLEEEKRLRLAEEEEAKQRAAEERRREEEQRAHREVAEQVRHEAQEAARRRQEEERVRAEHEAQRRAEQEAELQRVEAEPRRREEARRLSLPRQDSSGREGASQASQVDPDAKKNPSYSPETDRRVAFTIPEAPTSQTSAPKALRLVIALGVLLLIGGGGALGLFIFRWGEKPKISSNQQSSRPEAPVTNSPQSTPQQSTPAAAANRKVTAAETREVEQALTRGNLQRNAGNSDQAEKEYREALRINPREARAHTGLGGVLFDQGLYEQALLEFKKAIDLDPRDDKSHYNLGLTYLMTGNRAGAEGEYRALQGLKSALADELSKEIKKQ